MSKNIFIYNGLGAGKESVEQTHHMFRELKPSHAIYFIDDQGVIQKEWTTIASLFVMPGGADLPYVAKLKGNPNSVIKDFVNKGGTYLGICAGAYYGSSYVEFDKDGPLQVVGERELGFFPGKAIGPILAKYDYQSNSGARATQIQTHLSSNPLYVFFNGGSYFELAHERENVKVLANYHMHNQPSLAAIVKMKSGEGIAVLSGVHFEFSPDLMDSRDRHLQDVIPILKKSDPARKDFILELLKELNL